MNLSAIVLTKDEEENITKCLESLKFCDEILVIDDYSLDATVKTAKSIGAKVFQRSLNSDYAAQRNFGITKASGKWILFVDADEIITKELASEIIQVTNDPTISYRGFYFKRFDYIFGKKIGHGEIGSVRLLRLARKGGGEWVRRVHEVWKIQGNTYELKSPLIHYPHQTLREFVKDVNRMSSLHAVANYEEGKRSSLLKIIFWPVLKFINNFIFKGGFKDGNPGFVIALIMSFHSFLSWSKLWLYQKKTN